MCGILGWISLDGAPVPRARLEAALPSLAHRGPDHQGIWSDRHCWLGHRRLSILDLSPGGHQPMASPDGRYRIVYNGEFYNYRDHIPQLESKGYPLASSGDTAVLLGLYSLFGPEALSRIDGMFAMAIWDARERRLFLARDRLGKKPLYYSLDKNRICFASELKALSGLPGARSVDGAAVEAYFALGYVPSPLSIYKEVRKLEPATYAVVAAGSPFSRRRYWNPTPPDREGVSDGEVEAALTDCVRLRLVSDVPVGVLLSGGIDSSLIAALAAGPLRRALSAYCMAGGPGGYDERPFAARVAGHCGLKLLTDTIETSPADLLDRALSVLDEPFADSSILPTFAVCELAARHGKVVLSGEGGDELFGGYEKYLRFLAVRSFRRLPAFLRRAVGAQAWAADGRAGSWLRSAVRLARHSLTDDLGVLAAFHSQTRPRFRAPSFTAAFREEFGLDNEEYYRPHADERFAAFSLKRVLDIDRRTYLADDLLVKADRMSMANSLEVRCPFLDYRLVELSLRLPERDIIDGRRTKTLLRRLAARHLPKDIVERRKKGFSIPVSDWLRTEFAPLFRDHVRKDSGLSDIFDYRELDDRLALHRERRGEFGNHLWAVLMFHLWWRRWGRPATPAEP